MTEQTKRPRMRVLKIVLLSYLPVVAIWFNYLMSHDRLTTGKLAGVAIDRVIKDLGTDTNQLWFFLNPTPEVLPGETGPVYRISGSVSHGYPPAFQFELENFQYDIDDDGILRYPHRTTHKDVPDYLSD